VKPPVALTIAGTDSGGGAGIAADLKTFAAHGVWGTCAVTAVTAQNTVRVSACKALPATVISRQISAVVEDIGVAATKTGMLAGAGIVEVVAGTVAALDLHPVVVDPVALTTTGSPLLSAAGVVSMREVLLPQAELVTPNLAEAAALAGWLEPPLDRQAVERVADEILALGPAAVLVTGGHLAGPDAADLLARRDGYRRWFSGPRLESPNTHGTGCVLSAAITARLARGEDLVQAVEGAKAFVTAAIAAGVELGAGPGAVNPSSGSSPP
jgi:hydroxymethylpyrimidine/phosphomethylpyrimidine kinase